MDEKGKPAVVTVCVPEAEGAAAAAAAPGGLSAELVRVGSGSEILTVVRPQGIEGH